MSSNKRSSYFEESRYKRIETKIKNNDRVFGSTFMETLPPDFVPPTHLDIHTAKGLVSIPIKNARTTVDKVIKKFEKMIKDDHSQSELFPNTKNGNMSSTTFLSPTFVALRGSNSMAKIFFCNPQWIGQPFHRALMINDGGWYSPPVVFKLDFVDSLTPFVPRPVGYIPNLVVAVASGGNINLSHLFYCFFAHHFGVFNEVKPVFSFEIASSAGRHINGGDVTHVIECGERKPIETLNICRVDKSTWTGGANLFAEEDYSGIEDYFRVEIILHNKI